MLGNEPFALAHVYVDTECGKLAWGEIDQGARRRGHEAIDPFNEKHGGRYALLDTVLDLLATPDLKDAIVIQGPAGSGKSSFTLRLCWELLRLGLRPIRIALKHLDTRDAVSIAESLPAAVRIDDCQRNPNAEQLTFGRELFGDQDAIFAERIQFNGHTICPYVLILDGWDEISIGASAAYQSRVERVLGEVRQRFLEARGVPVRVILTGRPTEAVVKSKFLRQDSMILTVRPLRPEQLRIYLSHLAQAVRDAPLGLSTNIESWQGLEQVKIDELLAHYAEDWKQHSRTAGSLDVLGSPLLAFLALRLLARQPEHTELFLQDTTALYRSLIDLVVDKSGKPAEADDDLIGRAVLRGDELRDLLRGTAEAMTLRGAEHITHDQLAAHLQLDEDEMGHRVGTLANEHVLSHLMISFFFHVGQPELGCEFSHKSFREYLFAEQILECLKTHGRTTEEVCPERPAKEYGRDFSENDPRYTLSRSLAYVVGPQWMSQEVTQHVDRLLTWEIARAANSDSYPVVGTPTEALSLDGWKRVRDHLADVWDWWAEGVHLRPQLRQKSRGRRQVTYETISPFAVEIILAACEQPLDVRTFRPMRTVTVDGHLGNALFDLTSTVHRELAFQAGYESAVDKNGLTLTRSEPGNGPRRYQCLVQSGESNWVLFAPSGRSSTYLANYLARINAAGWRPYGTAPRGFDLRALDLRLVQLPHVDLCEADLSATDLSKGNLSESFLMQANLEKAKLQETDLNHANLLEAKIAWADLSKANLNGARLDSADLSNADFHGADLSCANLDAWILDGANFTEASLEGAIVSRKKLVHAKTEGAHGLHDLKEIDEFEGVDATGRT